jgi:NO-binding membrane sensor protein with MHYT domain
MLGPLANYFQTLPLPANSYNGTYDLRLVALSYIVAVFASYIALDMTGRLRDRNNTKTSGLLWLLGGAIAMGSGIWSMHFIGMLSFSIPGLTAVPAILADLHH